jgi:hypothetical protein
MEDAQAAVGRDGPAEDGEHPARRTLAGRQRTPAETAQARQDLRPSADGTDGRSSRRSERKQGGHRRQEMGASQAGGRCRRRHAHGPRKTPRPPPVRHLAPLFPVGIPAAEGIHILRRTRQDGPESHPQWPDVGLRRAGPPAVSGTAATSGASAARRLGRPSSAASPSAWPMNSPKKHGVQCAGPDRVRRLDRRVRRRRDPGPLRDRPDRRDRLDRLDRRDEGGLSAVSGPGAGRFRSSGGCNPGADAIRRNRTAGGRPARSARTPDRTPPAGRRTYIHPPP